MCYLNNICFACLSNKDIVNTVYHKETDNEIFIQVKYALPELTILDSEIPVCICSSCHTTLWSFYTFKKNCMENYSRLKYYIKTLQETNDAQDQSFSEFQNKVPMVKQEQEQDIDLNIKEENVDSLLPSSATEEIFRKLEMKIDDNKLLIKHEPELHIISNIKDMDETVVKDNIVVKEELVTEQEEQNDQIGQRQDISMSKTVVEDNIEEDSLVSPQELNQQPEFVNVKCATVSDDEQDGGLSATSVDKNAVENGDINFSTYIDSQSFQCPVCKEMFTDRLTFDTHLRNHISYVPVVECVICNKKLSNKSYLNRHMKIHRGIKDNECSVCKKKFTEVSNLRTHMKSHLGIRNYECLICKKKFIHNGNLKTHMKIHERIKDYECSICNKKYSQSSHLKTHMKIHERVNDVQFSDTNLYNWQFKNI